MAYGLKASSCNPLSPYFERMFYGGAWKEGNGDDVKLEEPQDCADVFGTFLRYFYSGSVSVTRETVIPIVTLADKYDVKSLKDICTTYMIEMLNTHHDFGAALCWVTFAEQMRMHDLQRKCYDLICFNFEKACDLGDWNSLSLEQVLNVLKRSDIVVSNEYVVFQAVEAWLKDKTAMVKEISQLLSYVQFKNMTIQEMCQVEKSALASQYEGKSDNPLTPYLSGAFRYLAVKTLYPEGDKESASLQRCYTAAQSSKLTTARLGSSGCAILKPSCKWSQEPLEYKWELQRSDEVRRYHIKLPNVFRTVRIGYSHQTTRSLYTELPDTYNFKLTFIFRSKAGHVLCAMNDSFKAQIPRSNDQKLKEFPESISMSESNDKIPENVVYDVMYSFLIEKV